MMNQQCENVCVKNAYVKMHKKSLSLAVKLNVIKHTEVGEHQLYVRKVLDLEGSPVQSILKNGMIATTLGASKLNTAQSTCNC